MKKLNQLLLDHDFLKGMDEVLVGLLAAYAEEVVFEPGEYIFHESEEATKFYLICEGKVELQMYAPGRGNVIIETLGPDEVVGWSWLVRPHHWHLSAKIAHRTRAVALDAKALIHQSESNHDLGYEMLKRLVNVISHRLLRTRLKIIEAYEVDA
jgi:CRP/FNR family cyclic AMP-dependent transcriptional regulator